MYVRGIDFYSVSTIFRFYFRTVQTEWYFILELFRQSGILF